MSLWKTERISSPPFDLSVPARHLDLAAVVVVAAALVLLLFWLVPLRLVLPALSIASFVIAGIAAIVAHHLGIDRRAPGITAWHVAAAFTLVWLAAGMVSGAKHFSEVFDRVAIAP